MNIALYFICLLFVRQHSDVKWNSAKCGGIVTCLNCLLVIDLTIYELNFYYISTVYLRLTLIQIVVPEILER